jgi:hypothetical protein
MSYHISPTPSATFSSSVTQSITNAANSQAVTYNTTLAAQGITLVSNSRIVLPQVGNYCFTFSAIGHNSGSASAKSLNLWIRKNGTDEANTSTIVGTSKDAPTTIVATFIVSCTTSGDYFELWMAGQDTTAQILATAAQAAVPGVSPAQPACPSVVTAVWQIS